ncbi:MAG: helix-turn-helix domain-containing protein, partial [Hyphomicrobiaceae bacterium]|nr:helix-turn-helix domain-containing protein [Hyphomicrobiaceae bacterium]
MRDLSCGDARIYLEVEVRRVDCRTCGHVKREQLEFLADNPFYTKRFAFYVGRRCRQGTITDLAHELGLDWHTVKALEMQYMRAQLAKAGTPGPKAIGIDEISIRKGHTYRIVVSDLIRRRPIWFGGDDRSEASMAQFYKWLGEDKAHGSCPLAWCKSASHGPSSTMARAVAQAAAMRLRPPCGSSLNVASFSR